MRCMVAILILAASFDLTLTNEAMHVEVHLDKYKSRLIAMGLVHFKLTQGGKGSEQGFSSFPVYSGPRGLGGGGFWRGRSTRGPSLQLGEGPLSELGFLVALSPPCVSDCFPKSVDIFLHLPAYLYAIN